MNQAVQLVIGLAGVKTAGKSTVTNILKKYFALEERALAEKLKDVSSMVFHVERSHFDDQAFKEVEFAEPKLLTDNHIRAVLALFGQSYVEDLSPYEEVLDMPLRSPRHIAQILGTQVLRKVGEDIHCENVVLSSDKVTVISDMRFPNEFAYFNKKEGIRFIPIYISRKVAEDQVTSESHASETSVFLFRDQCIRIDNNDTLEETERQLVEALYIERAL